MKSKAMWGAVGLGALVGLMAGAPARAATGAVARLVITPSGATLGTGQTLRFSAAAVDAAGNPVPNVTITWSSTKSSVVQVDRTGLATTRRTGQAALVARGGGIQSRATVAVVGTPAGGGAYAAAGLTQVNHVIEDEDSIYWTEVNNREVKIRKAAKTGGAITTVASEPARTFNALHVFYVQLRQIGDKLFFTRETVGFNGHWSIRCVAKSGGPITEILPEDTGAFPLLSNAWNVSGKYVVAALWRPQRLHLDLDTRIAAYDTEAGTWAPLLLGGYGQFKSSILAANDTEIYARAVTNNRQTQVVRVSTSGGANNLQVLHTQNSEDPALFQPGALDTSRVYFWSVRGAGPQKLYSVPVAGGAPTLLTTEDTGAALTADGSHVYYTRNDRVVLRLPAGGGTATQVQTQVFGTAALGGIPVDAVNLFLVRKLSAKNFVILRLAK